MAARPRRRGVAVEGDRWYGRGTADNKGQHSINLAALGACCARARPARLQLEVLIETGEETGSPGLDEFCKASTRRRSTPTC